MKFGTKYDGLDVDLTSSMNVRFPMKVYGLLEAIEDPTIACWTEDGSGFLINDNDRFCEHLPQFFKHKKLSSFQRQLNLYGFRRDKNSGAYCHPKFLKGRREFVGDIRRVATTTNNSASTSSSSTNIVADRRDNFSGDNDNGHRRNNTRNTSVRLVSDDNAFGDVNELRSLFDEPRLNTIDNEVEDSSNTMYNKNTWMNVKNHGQTHVTKGVILRRIDADDDDSPTSSTSSTGVTSYDNNQVKKRKHDNVITTSNENDDDNKPIKMSAITANLGYDSFISDNVDELCTSSELNV